MRIGPVLSTLVIPAITSAQFTVYTTFNSGLSDNYVGDVEPSSTGVWVATLNGLNHFDGTNWQLWNTLNSDLPHDIVTDLAVDDGGALWSWNYSEGCSRFDGNTFVQYTMADGLGSDAGSNVMFTGGSVWAGTYGGLSRLDGNTWTNYSTGNSSLPDNDARHCDMDASGGLWVPTFGGGIAYFANNSWTIHNTGNSLLPYDEVFVAEVHPNGHVWIGTRDGLVDFDNGTMTVYDDQNSILADTDIRDIGIGPNGEVLICTRFGGFYIIDANGTWTAYTTGNSNLPSNEVFSVAIDGGGRVWLGTTLGLAVAELITAAPSPPTANTGVVFTQRGEELTIALHNGPATIALYDALGRVLQAPAQRTGQAVIDLSAYAQGSFFVAVEEFNGARTSKQVVLLK